MGAIDHVSNDRLSLDQRPADHLPTTES